MKKSNVFKFAALGLLSVLVVACSKYEEGSKFTFLTKKSRVVNNWNLDKVEYTNGSTTGSNTVSDISIDVKKDNTYTFTFGSLTDSGTWDFSDDKTKLMMTDSDGNVTSSTIIMLKKDEMKLQDVDGSTTTTYFYSTK